MAKASDKAAEKDKQSADEKSADDVQKSAPADMPEDEADSTAEADAKKPKSAGIMGQTLHGDVFIDGDNGRESIAPMEDVPDDLNSLDLDDVRVRAELKAYRNQIDVANSDPNMVKKIDAVLRNYAAE